MQLAAVANVAPADACDLGVLGDPRAFPSRQVPLDAPATPDRILMAAQACDTNRCRAFPRRRRRGASGRWQGRRCGALEPAARASVVGREVAAALALGAAQVASMVQAPRVRGTANPPCEKCRRPVHPRVCGERHQCPPRQYAAVRFIPACAGNGLQSTNARRARTVHPRVCGEQSAYDTGDWLRSAVHPRVCGERTRPARRAMRLAAVHPRVCGERIWPIWPWRAQASGSSPRVRGTGIPLCRDTNRIHTVHPRVCGERDAAPVGPLDHPVHPRVCGEQLDGLAGASRRDRFIPACAGNGVAWPLSSTAPLRFIPACAGNSALRVPERSLRAVHPRVCGEQVALDADRGMWTPVHPRVCGEQAVHRSHGATGRGSSPRVRGTDLPLGAASVASRFIPACAGNRPQWPGAGRHPCGSSPRVRGTVRCPAACEVRLAGSAPRVRGTASQCRAWQRRAVHPRVCGEQSMYGRWRRPSARFIPACAGNSVACAVRDRHVAVHPRVCGEQSSVAACDSADGSSPRVRGTECRYDQEPSCRSRFIPACAGNRPAAARAALAGSSGSSPRVRGTDGRAPREIGTSSRFIPACAGNRQRPVRRRAVRAVHPRVCGEQRCSRRAM